MSRDLHFEPGGLSPLAAAGVIRNLTQLVSRRNRQRLSSAEQLAPGERFLQWAREFLPRHLRCEPSGMHRWLAAELEQSQNERGAKLNVIGPRGGAKSTVVTLAYVLKVSGRLLAGRNLAKRPRKQAFIACSLI